MEAKPLIKIEHLYKSYEYRDNFFAPLKTKEVIKDFNYEIYEGETIGLVGPSGVGKTTLVKCLLGVEKADKGEIIIEGNKRIQMIMQDPNSAIDAKMRIRDLLVDTAGLYNSDLSKEERFERASEMLEICGINRSEIDKFPDQLSGGQKQRVCIARALLTEPDILICDEITASLDVSIQAQILNLLLDLKERFNLTVIFISHDMELVEILSDRIIRMGKTE